MVRQILEQETVVRGGVKSRQGDRTLATSLRKSQFAFLGAKLAMASWSERRVHRISGGSKEAKSKESEPLALEDQARGGVDGRLRG